MRIYTYCTLLLSLLVAIASSPSVNAAVVITATETAGETVFVAEGTLNLSGLSPDPTNPFSAPSYSWPRLPGLSLGANPTDNIPIDGYVGISTAPDSFGTGSFIQPSSGTGDRFGVFYSSNISNMTDVLLVPDGFTGGAINSTSTFTGHDFESLGITPGSYVWSWGTGVNADSVTLNVVAIPEPSSVAALASLGLVITIGRRRRRTI